MAYGVGTSVLRQVDQALPQQRFSLLMKIQFVHIAYIHPAVQIELVTIIDFVYSFSFSFLFHACTGGLSKPGASMDYYVTLPFQRKPIV